MTDSETCDNHKKPTKRLRTEEENSDSVTDVNNSETSSSLRDRAFLYFSSNCVFTSRPPVDQLTQRLMQCLRPHLNKPHLEVELRFCLLCDERSQRIRPPIETPAVLSSKVRSAEVGLASKDFEKIKSLLQKHWAFHEPQAGGAVSVRESKTRDVVHGGVRESTDVKSGQTLQTVKKQRLALCDISCPRHKYDLRFAVNQEVPCDAANSGGGGFVREKSRTSFEVGPFVFDLTEVKSGNSASQTYEVEIEGVPPTASAGPCVEEWLQVLVANSFSLMAEI